MPFGPKGWKMDYDPVEERYELVPDDWEYYPDYGRILELEKREKEQIELNRWYHSEEYRLLQEQELEKKIQRKKEYARSLAKDIYKTYKELSPDGQKVLLALLPSLIDKLLED